MNRRIFQRDGVNRTHYSSILSDPEALRAGGQHSIFLPLEAG
jgi:hypothetical protein